MSKFFIKQAFAEAMDLQKNGRLSEAKEIYLKILGQSPNDANALHLISLVFMAEGNYNEAKSYIEKAINEAPNQAVFHSNYGGLLHTMGDLPASVKALKKEFALLPLTGEVANIGKVTPYSVLQNSFTSDSSLYS